MKSCVNEWRSHREHDCVVYVKCSSKILLPYFLCLTHSLKNVTNIESFSFQIFLSGCVDSIRRKSVISERKAFLFRFSITTITDNICAVLLLPAQKPYKFVVSYSHCVYFAFRMLKYFRRVMLLCLLVVLVRVTIWLSEVKMRQLETDAYIKAIFS